MTNSPYDVVSQFEKSVATYTGSKYAVAVDSCTNALFLCCKYLNVGIVNIPARTYVSVPCSILHAGGQVNFNNDQWDGAYQLKPYEIYDSACRFRKGMYKPGSYWCVSFSSNKPVPIGRGGMILTDSPAAVEWFKLARYHGRHEVPTAEDKFAMVGWSMFMTPEQAARGLLLMHHVKDENPDVIGSYQDLSKYPMYSEPAG